MKQFDVIVIGGGHAGCEASLVSARMGLTTALLTLDTTKIAEMSCNPSIGGVGKGQLTKELDALGGEMGINADYTGIQFKRLNLKKGSAVQSTRCQSDKKLYAQRMQKVIKDQPKLTVIEGEVKSLSVDPIEGGAIARGIVFQPKSGGAETLAAKKIVVTAGTFMKGLMHVGDEKSEGGRFGEGSSIGLSDYLRSLGVKISRLKTGTPARLLRDSIDFTKMEANWGDIPYPRFSFSQTEVTLPQVACYLGYTNARTHEVIRENMARSPLYSGKIKGIGPRYCPSIEDKVVKFPEKTRHQLFFEPEALDSDWIYPNGISTSLPSDVQEAFIRTIVGCEEAKFARFGYAVEYDCIDPAELHPTLESKKIHNLYFAGQVNGTSGYEEAATQGFMAGVNAALKVLERPPLILSRSQGYIGVMIDDLIHQGISEPYRMFTSRAEFRLSLREDNADLRLRPIAKDLGLISDDEYARFLDRKERLAKAKAYMAKTFIKQSDALNETLASVGSSPMHSSQTLANILKRPEVGLDDVIPYSPENHFENLTHEDKETLEVEIKFDGYITIQKQEIDRLARMQELEIPADFNFAPLAGISFEVKEKLNKFRPNNLAEASRLPGITPAALTTLMGHLKAREKFAKQSHTSI